MCADCVIATVFTIALLPLGVFAVWQIVLNEKGLQRDREVFEEERRLYLAQIRERRGELLRKELRRISDDAKSARGDADG